MCVRVPPVLPRRSCSESLPSLRFPRRSRRMCGLTQPFISRMNETIPLWLSFCCKTARRRRKERRTRWACCPSSSSRTITPSSSTSAHCCPDRIYRILCHPCLSPSLPHVRAATPWHRCLTCCGSACASSVCVLLFMIVHVLACAACVRMTPPPLQGAT